MKPKVIVIVGPTASGKTSLSIELAKQINGEIVSCDSMQIYKDMDIGSAKPTKEEMQGIKHYMIDEVLPTERFSVARYKKEAENAIEKILKKGKIPIVVGGTGLYANSLIYGIEYDDIKLDEKYREELMEIAKTPEGLENLYQKAKKIDEKAIEKTSLKDENDVISLWENINNDFKRLNQDYQDYIKTFYNVKLEEVAKSKQFIIYKNDLVRYLREFIKLLQDNSYSIEEILKTMNKPTEENFLEKVYLGQKKRVRIDKLDEEINEEEMKTRNKEKWENLKKWFIGSNIRASEVEKINEKTTEIIRKITRIANQIAEAKGNVSNKKAEYKKICELFSKTQDIEEAHKLSSVVFGMFNTRHIKGNFVRDTDSINSSLIEEKSNEYEVKPRIREYREKQSKTAIIDKTKEKQEQIERYFKQIEEERKELQKYIQNGKIEIKKLPTIKSSFRKTLLKWISKASQMANKEIVIEDGRKIKLIYPKNNERCVLNCEDGKMDMPAFELEFIEKID